MTERSIVIMGLPGSGKTTFLAALWHLVTARDIDSALRFSGLGRGDSAHLNAIAARWRDAKVQDRTAVGGNRLVKMNLTDPLGNTAGLTFPDTAGEAFARMWEDRECDAAVATTLDADSVMLFIHADTIEPPMWVVDEVALAKRMGLAPPEGDTVSWHPRLAPTQVQVVDLLQLLTSPRLNRESRRLAIMLSAWDKAEHEGMLPSAFIKHKLPLLAQYLARNGSRWISRIYGISAQGGDYDATEAGTAPKAEAAALRKLDRPSTRIRLVRDGMETHDLTEPLAWLLAS